MIFKVIVLRVERIEFLAVHMSFAVPTVYFSANCSANLYALCSKRVLSKVCLARVVARESSGRAARRPDSDNPLKSTRGPSKRSCVRSLKEAPSTKPNSPYVGGQYGSQNSL